MTIIRFLVRNSLQDFARNKLRTLLTSLGILIGVASVVLLLSFGLGLKAYIQNQFESLGSNLVIVVPGSFGQGGIGFRPGAFGSINFNEKDLQYLRRLNEVSEVTGVFAKTIKVSTSSESQTVDVLAATPEIFPARNFEIDLGRLFDKTDVDKRNKVVVLGPKTADELFGSGKRALGKVVKLESQGYVVIGVLKSKGSGGFGGPDIDAFVFTPYTAAYQFNQDKKFISFYLKAKSGMTVSAVKNSAKRSMLKRYEEDEFTVIEQTEVLTTITSIFGVLNMILVSIGAISLIVGGVGIMNIMYVTVTERVKEIGIRRAVGATKRDLLLQFLTEATTLSLLGGMMGLGVSFLVVLVVQRYFPAYIDTVSVLVALVVSMLIGIIFGVLPAKKAADMSPIEAIRYE